MSHSPRPQAVGKQEKVRPNLSKGMPYIGDVKLLPRIKKYFDNKSAKAPTDVESIVTHLQNTYPDYKRKKRNAFRHSVSRALDVLVEEYEQEESADEGDVDILSANRPIARQTSKEASELPVKDSDMSFSDDAVYTEYQDSNTVNSLLTGLYSQNTPGASSPSQATQRSNKKTGFLRCQSDPVLANNSQVNGLAFIDRGNGPGTPVNPSKLIESLPASPRLPQQQEHTDSETGETAKPPPQTKRLPVVITIGDEEEEVRSVNKTPVAGKRKDSQTPNSNRKKLKASIKVKTPTQPSDSASSSATPSNQSTSGASKKKGAIDAVYSNTTFSQIGGNEKTIQEVQQLLLHMKYPEIYHQIGISPPRGFLLHGPPGCGKTLMAHAIAGELKLPFYKLAATELVSGVSGESEERVRSLFNKAASNAPCILFIDEVDSITPKRETASKDMERRIVSQFLSCLDDLCEKKDAHVLVIGATNRPDSLDPALRRAGRFDREICMGIPDVAARESILRVLCKDIRLADNFDYNSISRLTPGYVGADLGSLVREAAMSAVNRILSSVGEHSSSSNNKDGAPTEPTQVNTDTGGGGTEAVEMELSDGDNPTAESQSTQGETISTVTPTIPSASLAAKADVSSWWDNLPSIPAEILKSLHIDLHDFQEALKLVQPSAKREGFATVPDVTWDDIGALYSIREELQMAILAPVKYPDQFKSLGLNSPSGVLLAGPPGCGKTLLAKAIANESGINFISVKGPELINMYVGESEKAVRQVFQRARNSTPCVVFFDELDSLCPKRSLSGSDGGSGSRVVNQLLTEMDGLEERKQVFVMGATNRPDIIDPAVLRPGRLDKTLYVGLPTLEDRVDILRTITKNCTKPPIEGVDLAELAALPKCDGFSGADLSAVVREASMAAMKQYISTSESQQVELAADAKIVVNREHFDIALDKVKPSISSKDRDRYQKMAAA